MLSIFIFSEFIADLSSSRENAAIRKRLEKKAIRCPYACDAEITWRTLDAHINQCLEKPILCEQCQKSLPQKNLSSHQTKCPQRIVDCSFGCGFRATAVAMEVS